MLVRLSAPTVCDRRSALARWGTARAARASDPGGRLTGMSTKEQYALWAHQVRERVDARQVELELGLVTRGPRASTWWRDEVGEESQDPGGWDAA